MTIDTTPSIYMIVEPRDGSRPSRPAWHTTIHTRLGITDDTIWLEAQLTTQHIHNIVHSTIQQLACYMVGPTRQDSIVITLKVRKRCKSRIQANYISNIQSTSIPKIGICCILQPLFYVYYGAHKFSQKRWKRHNWLYSHDDTPTFRFRRLTVFIHPFDSRINQLSHIRFWTELHIMLVLYMNYTHTFIYMSM